MPSTPPAIDQYQKWLGISARLSGDSQGADDLLQQGLLAALEAQRKPFQEPRDAAWFYGVLRNLAAQTIRQTRRRQARESSYAEENSQPGRETILGGSSIPALPPAQRLVLLLALNGLNKSEICQVLGIADATLRQRLSAMRKKLASQEARRKIDPASLAAAYAARMDSANPPGAGQRRAALAQGPARLADFRFGITDPDCNLLAISRSPEK
ncbi:sigma factor-like helix-turn-helix DNA-binding protein [Microbulbifer sp. TYP-18]|uniref:sigma factor-like helix-turn-helix DNA-binding protein n=1 Tax=Microbulbifer sp. TYP-18 TaxID=3230024 RepID=UPI0034C617AD